jgi:hypothetical protein
VQLVNGMSADLLLCDSGSRVLMVVELQATQPTENSRRRHERMARLLKAAGIKVVTWPDHMLPDVQTIRNQLVPLLTQSKGRPAPAPTGSRPMPLIPVADVAEVLAEGDALAAEGPMEEPVPSAMFDDLEADLAVPKR